MGIFEREQSLVRMIHRTLTRGIPTGDQVIRVFFGGTKFGWRRS